MKNNSSLGGQSCQGSSTCIGIQAEFNPCSKVDLFPLDNLRYRYLLPDEEPRLMAELSGPGVHLKPAVIVALGTGMRLGEQLRMKRSQVDFLLNIVTARKTKNGRPRDIPMNDEVRETLAELCRDKRPDEATNEIRPPVPAAVND